MLVFIGAGGAAVFALSLITWLALSKNSSPGVRRAAIAALILITLGVIVILILNFSEGAVIAGPLPSDRPPEPVQPRKEMSLSLVVFVVLILAFLTLIIFLAFRRERRRDGGVSGEASGRRNGRGGADIPTGAQSSERRGG